MSANSRPRKAPSSEKGRSSALTLSEFAGHKRLPVEFLNEHGVVESPLGGIIFRYADMTGEILAEKRRSALAAKEGSYWPKGVEVEAYGQNHLADAQRERRLHLVEGESAPQSPGDADTVVVYGQISPKA